MKSNAQKKAIMKALDKEKNVIPKGVRKIKPNIHGITYQPFKHEGKTSMLKVNHITKDDYEKYKNNK